MEVCAQTYSCVLCTQSSIKKKLACIIRDVTGKILDINFQELNVSLVFADLQIF